MPPTSGAAWFLRPMQIGRLIAKAGTPGLYSIIDGLTAGVDDIAPDPMSAEVWGTFVRDPRAVEKKFAG